MALGGMSSTFLGGIGAAVFGVGLHIIGLATTGWSTFDSGRASSEAGLFRYCSCADLPDISETSELRAVRAMTIIGALIALVGVALLFVYAICLGLGRTFLSQTYLISGIACMVAFVFILIGIIVYAVEVHKDPSDLDYSFGLSTAGGILLFIGGILVLMAGRAFG